MQPKKKPCKGTGLAKGYGCGKMTYHRIYGLGKMCCYSDWLLNSENGKIKMQKAMLKASKPRREFEEFKKERKTKSVISQLLKLTRNVCHEYIRLRDKGKPCISCGTQWHQEFPSRTFLQS